MSDQSYSLIFAIVNRGFSGVVMEGARSAGARGGTIMNARGTGSLDIEKFMGMTIEPEKEIILILAPKEKRKDIMKAIYKTAGLNTEGNGFAIALPVEEVVGLFNLTKAKENKDAKDGAAAE